MGEVRAGLRKKVCIERGEKRKRERKGVKEHETEGGGERRGEDAHRRPPVPRRAGGRLGGVAVSSPAPLFLHTHPRAALGSSAEPVTAAARLA